MSTKDGKTGDRRPPSPREARLKAALKANLARRKSQARARKATGETPQPGDGGTDSPDRAE